MHAGFSCENLNGKAHLQNLSTDGNKREIDSCGLG